ncbi:hypothetical protein [Aliikangiella sp. G2MR2-5]|uniref:hypothetical protein n=1 Tax=Aliikangiella sp. G2MR2-5 TaxID=2788943 RepID=UPI0018AAAF23|nr:hypothetical protein [Aliikangiella sp. G2MR2-5]
MTGTSKFKAIRIELAATSRSDFPVEQVFPLLCPAREFDWIPHWDCRLIYSQSGIAELGCVFTTEFEKDHALDTWVISEFLPNRKIQFIRINEFRSIKYDLNIQSNDGFTEILWSQQITALNEQGNVLVKSITQADFDEQITKVEKLLNYYLAHGKAMLSES